MIQTTLIGRLHAIKANTTVISMIVILLSEATWLVECILVEALTASIMLTLRKLESELANSKQWYDEPLHTLPHNSVQKLKFEI